MFSSVKTWLLGAGTAAIGVVLAMLAYRGNKIEALEDEVVTMKHNEAVKEKIVEAEKSSAEFIANNRVAAAKAHARDAVEIEETFYSI